MRATSSTARNGLRTKSSAPDSKARAISVVRVERGEDDDGDVARLRTRPEDAKHLVPVGRRHHEVEQDERRSNLIDLLERLGAGAHGHVRQVCGDQRLAEDVAAYRIVVHDKDETLRHDTSLRPKPRFSTLFVLEQQRLLR